MEPRTTLLVLLLAAVTPCSRGGPPAQVVVQVTAPGLDAVAVEVQVTNHLEEALAQMPHVTRLDSASSAGAATITLSVDGDEAGAARDAEVRLGLVLTELPRQASMPRVTAVQGRAPKRFLVAGELSAAELRDIADRAARELGAEACGGALPRVLIEIDPARAAALGVDGHRLEQSLRPALRALATDRATGSTVMASLGRVELHHTQDGMPIRLEDVARIIYGAEPDACDAPGVILTLRADEARAASALRELHLPPGAHLEPLPTALAVQITGSDHGVLSELAPRLADQLRAVPGVTGVTISGAELTPRLVPTVDTNAAAALGLGDVDALLPLALDELEIGRLELDGRQLPFFLRFLGDDPLARLRGVEPRLPSVVTVSLSAAPRTILHRNRQRVVVLRVTGAEEQALLPVIQQLQLPVGYSVVID